MPKYIFVFGDLNKKLFDKECLKSSVKFATSVKIWHCMAARGRGRLCIVSTKVNSEVYQEIPSSEDFCDAFKKLRKKTKKILFLVHEFELSKFMQILLIKKKINK